MWPPLKLSYLALAACFGATRATTFSASYRKDAWLPNYFEAGVPLPLTGGRVHVVGLATGSGAPERVYLNGTLVDVSSPGSGNPDSWPIDWLRVEPLPTGLVAGSPFWVSFHSRLKAWDEAAISGAQTSLRVEDAGGAALLDGTFTLHAAQGVQLTWATTAGNRSTLLMYLHNSAPLGAPPAQLASALVNGGDVMAGLPASAQQVPAGATVMWELPAAAVPGGGSAALAAGRVWSAELSWSSGSLSTTAGGILWPEFFPIETWPHGSDCPFPTLNDSSYAAHRAAGVDTFFTEWTPDGGCPKNHLNAADLVNVLAPKYDFWVLPSGEGGAKLAADINDTSRLAGWFLADEDDTVVDKKARELLAAVEAVRVALPGVPTYAGGASQLYTGAFAGITDIKGMDAYIGACAPHYALLPMPARGSYDYLSNTRANHAPGPTWLYTQGFENGWDSHLDGANKQANAAEIAIQVASVPAAGAKGLMIFETQLSYQKGISAPAWATLATMLHEVGALRELYRAGDASGMVAAWNASGGQAPDVVAEGILSPRAMVVLLINTAAVNDTYNEVCCVLDLAACHFTFVPSSLAEVVVGLPAGAVVADAFELFNATVLPGSPPLGPPPAGSGGTLSLSNITLGTEGPGSPPCTEPARAIVRTFVLAFDTKLRAEVAAALVPGQGKAPAAVRDQLTVV